MSEATYKARYWRYFSEIEEECDTLDEAVAFLANGWERGELSEIEIEDPDGAVALGGDALHKRMLALLGV
jgi:hypothetical protein